MKFIFDWSTSYSEEKTTWRSDEEIISLEISQKECSFASARVVICSKNTEKLFDRKYAKIGIQNGSSPVKLLFSGRLVSFPAGFGNGTVELELISEPDDYQNQLDRFYAKKIAEYKEIDKHAPENGAIPLDELFYSAEDINNPAIFLESRNEVFCWDMKSGRLSLSDINGGTKHFEISGKDILQNSLKVRLAREPYKAVNLKLSASWIQHVRGIIDVLPMIAQKFRHGLINSLTNIKAGIENICRFHPKSGYSLLRCKIKEITPAGFLQQYPIVSPEFQVQEGHISKGVKFKRFYFNGELVLGWNYKQKRTETVNIKVENSLSEHGREKTILLKLNSLQLPKKYSKWNYFSYYGCGDKVLFNGCVFECKDAHISSKEFDESKWDFTAKIPDAIRDDSCSSFFATERGKNAIKYAIQKAIATINYSMRYIEIDLCVSAENFLFTDIDSTVTIRDSRFRNGYISGKIIKTKLSANADRKIVKITVGCTRDKFSEDCFGRPISVAIEDDDCKIHPADIVTDIEIKNPPEDQIGLLSEISARNIAELKACLKKHVTKIKLSLHPQNTTRVINREINLPDFRL